MAFLVSCGWGADPKVLFPVPGVRYETWDDYLMVGRDLHMSGVILNNTTSWAEADVVLHDTKTPNGSFPQGEAVRVLSWTLDRKYAERPERDYVLVSVEDDLKHLFDDQRMEGWIRKEMVKVRGPWAGLVGRQVEAVLVHDFDHDGREETVVHYGGCGRHTGVIFLRVRGETAKVIADFQPTEWETLAGGEWRVIDLDGDGTQELVVSAKICGSGGGDIPAVFWVDGDSVTMFAMQGAGGSYAFEDLNKDGRVEAIGWNKLEHPWWSNVSWPTVHKLSGRRYVEASREYLRWYRTTFSDRVRAEVAEAERAQPGFREPRLSQAIKVQKKLESFLGSRGK